MRFAKSESIRPPTNGYTDYRPRWSRTLRSRCQACDGRPPAHRICGWVSPQEITKALPELLSLRAVSPLRNADDQLWNDVIQKIVTRCFLFMPLGLLPTKAIANDGPRNTGLRKGSQYGLTWDMVDWKSRMLNISRAKNDEAANVSWGTAGRHCRSSGHKSLI